MDTKEEKVLNPCHYISYPKASSHPKREILAGIKESTLFYIRRISLILIIYIKLK